MKFVSSIEYDRLKSDYDRLSTAYIGLSNDYYKLKDKHDKLVLKHTEFKKNNAFHNFKDKFIIEFDKVSLDDVAKILDYLKR